MSSKVQPAADDEAPSDVPMKAIPGSYGVPFLSPIKDRLDFFYFQGADRFFQSRIDKYQSTVFRTNMPPGPFMAASPRVVALLDAKSFPVLFDVAKVEKRNVFTGTYTPSTSLTGGYRVCPYLDPSEPKHAKLKQLLLDLLASREPYVLPSFRSTYSTLFDAMESQLAASPSAKADFNKLNDDSSFEFVCDAYFGSRPSAFPSLGSAGPSKARKWLFLQLCPLATLGLPVVVEEIFLHTVPLPTVIVRSDYKALYSYFSSVAGPVLDAAEEQLGLPREEACHNLLFATVFNSYGGLKVLLPGILKWLSIAGRELHSKLVDEVRAAVEADVGAGGEITLSALQRMELTRSVVYEALRIDPPVKFQYGKAKTDLTIESHDAKFQVKEGEMLFGYQPFCTRDAKVFENGGEFAGDRFVGEKGRELLRSLVWSNGPETESPTAANKQCAGKDLVVLVGRLLVAEFFLRYDTFTAEIGTSSFGAQVTVTSLTRASAGHGRAVDD